MGREEFSPYFHNKRKKRARTNGFLAIDIFSGECYFTTSKTANSTDIAQYLADLALQNALLGVRKLVIFLDNNTTHKEKMQTLFKEQTAALNVETTFCFIAPYSPKLNLVEYAIHLIRQKVLHHADCKLGLSAFETQIQELCKRNELFNKEQIINLLEYIKSLIPIKEI